MTDPADHRAGPGARAPRRPALRVIDGEAAAGQAPRRTVSAATAAAMAAHPSSGLGVRRAPEPPAPERLPWGRLDPAGAEPGPGAVLLDGARPGQVLKVEDTAAGTALYLPVRTEGAVFTPEDPEAADALRLSLCRPGEAGVPAVTARHAFAETGTHWVAVGAPEAGDAEHPYRLTGAMRRAMAAGLDFLEGDQRMDRTIAQAYLAATAEFSTCRAGGGPLGVHVLLVKADFA